MRQWPYFSVPPASRLSATRGIVTTFAILIIAIVVIPVLISPLLNWVVGNCFCWIF